MRRSSSIRASTLETLIFLIVSTGRVGRMRPVRRLPPLVALCVFAAGCGGGGDGEAAPTMTATVAPPPPTTTTTRVPTRTNVVTVTVPKPTAQPRAKPTGRPRFTIRLAAESHVAEVGRRWRYTVRALKKGKPIGATAKMRVFLGNDLVDTLGFFTFEGTLRRTHRWQAVLKGKDVVLQAEVEGEGGTQRANWRVSVR